MNNWAPIQLQNAYLLIQLLVFIAKYSNTEYMITNLFTKYLITDSTFI